MVIGTASYATPQQLSFQRTLSREAQPTQCVEARLRGLRSQAAAWERDNALGLQPNAVKHFVLGNCWYSCIMRASISEKSIYVGRFLRNRHFEMLHSVAARADLLLPNFDFGHAAARRCAVREKDANFRGC